MKTNKPIKNNDGYIYIEGTIKSICLSCVSGDGNKKENGYECTLVIDLWDNKTNKEIVTVKHTAFFKLEHIVEFNDYKDKYTLDEKVRVAGYIDNHLQFNIANVSSRWI